MDCFCKFLSISILVLILAICIGNMYHVHCSCEKYFMDGH